MPFTCARIELCLQHTHLKILFKLIFCWPILIQPPGEMPIKASPNALKNGSHYLILLQATPTHRIICLENDGWRKTTSIKEIFMKKII